MVCVVRRRSLAAVCALALALPPCIAVSAEPGPSAGRPALSMADVAGLNRAFNRIEQRSDREAWGTDDHWATPQELAARGAGDCEDLAIAKYFALLERGVPEAQLRLLLVRLWRPDSGRIESHLVVAWHRDGEDDPWILDNVDDRVLRLSTRRDLVARLAFDRGRWWIHAGDRATEQTSEVPLAQWRAVLARHAPRR